MILNASDEKKKRSQEYCFCWRWHDMFGVTYFDRCWDSCVWYYVCSLMCAFRLLVCWCWVAGGWWNNRQLPLIHVDQSADTCISKFLLDAALDPLSHRLYCWHVPIKTTAMGYNFFVLPFKIGFVVWMQGLACHSNRNCTSSNNHFVCLFHF